MKFTTSVFNRSITIEMINDEIYQSENVFRVSLNGVEVLHTNLNVFSLYHLEPDTEYKIEVTSNGETAKETVRTMKESVCINVSDFGAKGDGKQDDTKYIQAAILACPEKGTVFIPKGTYAVTPIFLKSDITLYVDYGATLLGSTDRNQYPILPGMVQGTDEKTEYSLSSWEGNPLTSYASLITCMYCSNVDIIGEGILDGNASNSDWWKNHREKRGAWRPNTVFMNQCNHMRMQGLHVMNSPCWTIHPYYSDDLYFFDLTIQNPYDSPNTDGFDPESCRNVFLLGTKISVGDDCVAIKSGKIYMAKEHFKRTENIVVRNCNFEKGHGSVTVGSEIAGGVVGVQVEQCLFNETDRGMRLKTRRGRGQKSVLDQIHFEHIEMRNVHMPITVNMFYFCDPDGHTDYVQNTEKKPVTDMTPTIGTISIKHSTCTGADSSFLCAYGLPERPIEKIEVEDVQVRFLDPQEQRQDRPVMMDRIEPMKGVGIYVKNVNELLLKDVVIEGSSTKEPILENVQKSEYHTLKMDS